MTKKDVVPARTEGMAFPKDLLVPPQSQVQLYEDGVSNRIRELDAAASQLARGFGIGFSPGMHLNELHDRTRTDVLEVMVLVLVPTQRISLEKINGNWGLVYSYEPAAIRAANDRGYRGPLRDAPLDVREKFLHRSEEFFRRYLASCEDRLGSMKSAVDAGDKTLALIKSIELK